MKANGGKRVSFLELAHQGYLKTAIAMPTSGHSKTFVDQCYLVYYIINLTTIK